MLIMPAQIVNRRLITDASWNNQKLLAMVSVVIFSISIIFM